MIDGSFDDLTLGEVERLQREVLDGRPISDDANDPLLIAGGAMWMLLRRDKPEVGFDEFRDMVTMRELKAFSEANTADPTSAR